TIAGERRTLEQHGRSQTNRLREVRAVEAGQGLDDEAWPPALPLVEALAVAVDHLDPRDPFHVLLAVQARYEHADRVPVTGGQRFAVHLVHDQRRRIERLFDRERIGVAVDAAQ